MEPADAWIIEKALKDVSLGFLTVICSIVEELKTSHGFSQKRIAEYLKTLRRGHSEGAALSIIDASIGLFEGEQKAPLTVVQGGKADLQGGNS